MRRSFWNEGLPAIEPERLRPDLRPHKKNWPLDEHVVGVAEPCPATPMTAGPGTALDDLFVFEPGQVRFPVAE